MIGRWYSLGKVHSPEHSYLAIGWEEDYSDCRCLVLALEWIMDTFVTPGRAIYPTWISNSAKDKEYIYIYCIYVESVEDYNRDILLHMAKYLFSAVDRYSG